MKGKKRWLLVPLVILALLLSVIPAYAIPPVPHAFYGTLTMDGSPAPVGTVVTAKVGGVQYGTITTTVEGQYGSSDPLGDRLLVAPGEGDIETGDTIYFYADGNVANQTYAFDPDEVTELDLTTGVLPTDTTPPTVSITALTPDPTTDNTPTFTGTATDTESNIAGVEYKVDDGSWIAASASDGTFNSLSEGYTFTTAELLDGAHTVYVRATDSATTPNTTAEANYATDSFTVDTTAPTVSSTLPVADATGVAIGAAVSVTFDEAMAESTITTSSFTLDSVAGSVSYDSGTYTATFTPSANLAENTTYTATLSTAITDVAGNPLAAYSWSFTTTVDVPPTVASVSPLDGATDVVTYITVTATFDMAMDEATITTSSFTLSNGGAVSGTVSYDSGTYTATFTPTAKLDSNTIYTATLSTAITSAGGIPLASAYSWSFTTVYAGDANGDGVVDALDITKVERIVAGLDAQTPGADANQDGNINALDITKTERIAAGLD